MSRARVLGPLKSHKVGEPMHVISVEAQNSSRWWGGMLAQISSPPLYSGAKLRGPSPIPLVLLYMRCNCNSHSCNLRGYGGPK
ncbi:hypothetical protein TNCV_2827281 [Trichonephila clavipes]|nr:hypothetical protein TNCV_2827281 [Trichonephila clavipes]